MKIKGQLYKACVRSAMCYGAECWALREGGGDKTEDC